MMESRTFTILTVALLLSSCVEPIVMDPLEEMPVVVTCVLTREHQAQYLDLYYAKRPSEEKATPITDATVVVKDKDLSHFFTWNGERWQCNFLPTFGAKYSLEVRLADGTTLTSSTTYPSDYKLVGCMYESGADVQPLPYGKIPFVAFYFAKYYKESRLVDSYTVGHDTYTFYDTREGYKPYMGELYAWIMAGKRLCTDHIGADGFNMRTGSWKDLEPWPNYNYEHLSEDYVNYCSGLPLYQDFLRIHQPDGFKSVTPEGLIGPQTYTYWDTQADVDPNSIFVLASDASDGEREEEYNYATFDIYRVFFVSPEYDQYLRNMASVKVLRAGELAELYSTTPIYTNIEGGLGLFGASYTTGCYYGLSLTGPWF